MINVNQLNSTRKYHYLCDKKQYSLGKFEVIREHKLS